MIDNSSVIGFSNQISFCFRVVYIYIKYNLFWKLGQIIILNVF